MQPRAFSDHSYNQFLTEDQLTGSRCRKCGARYVPPRPLCIECYATDMEWQELSGRGTLAAFTCISIAPPAMVAQGYGRANPYCCGVVDLEAGGRVDARIEGVDPSHPETIRVGMPLNVRFLHRTVGGVAETYLAFEPA